MIIGNNNVFEVDCTSLALKIGDNNVLESKVCWHKGSKYRASIIEKPFSCGSGMGKISRQRQLNVKHYKICFSEMSWFFENLK